MKRRLAEAGFDHAISSPLNSQYVKEELTALVEENIENIDAAFTIHKLQQMEKPSVERV